MWPELPLQGRLQKHRQGKVVSLGRTWAVKLLVVIVVRMSNLSMKEERMLSTSWMAETMIGANEGSKLEPLSFCSSI